MKLLYHPSSAEILVSHFSAKFYILMTKAVVYEMGTSAFPEIADFSLLRDMVMKTGDFSKQMDKLKHHQPASSHSKTWIQKNTAGSLSSFKLNHNHLTWTDE